jgi:hypothetical protein
MKKVFNCSEVTSYKIHTLVFCHSQVLTERRSNASFALTPPFHVNTWTGTWQVLMRVAIIIDIFAENVLSVASLWII